MKYLKAIWKALRPFSFTIAFISCLLGIVLAWREGYADFHKAFLIILSGILLQSGVNLVNDFFEFKQGKLENKIACFHIFGREREWTEICIFIAGLLCFACTVPIGLYLVYRSGMQLFYLGVIGFVGGYFYTGEPFNYKRRGLAVVFVFFLMGVFMIYGSYYAMTAKFSMEVLWISLPISLLVSLLLLSNELRDYERDKERDIRTLTVRIGYQKGKMLYVVFVIAAAVFTIIFVYCSILPKMCLFVLLSLSVAKRAYSYIDQKPKLRMPLTPLTAKFHFLFGLLLIVGLLVDHGA
ncbi:prenyltransferase [Thermotalea metallivorans]|uniref:1,4-dihydroxy-2-naphthoate octaprenyltransferase n=1 Tax=Thermotalea metallivorans TaxID=520762 RepID=A0A140LBG9_9FIRM|nr:prenyltransferase [Thermotalea metallivorans]KXG77894.1 1,4-dihydroxy-2-naphthoate octaprenyltransferase [Thermotalea metallivorans]